MKLRSILFLFCGILLFCGCSRSVHDEGVEVSLNLIVPKTWQSGRLDGLSYGGGGGRFSFLHRGFSDAESSHAVWFDIVENQEGEQNLAGVVLYRLDLERGRILLDISSDIEFSIHVSGAVEMRKEFRLGDEGMHQVIEIKL